MRINEMDEVYYLEAMNELYSNHFMREEAE